MSDSPASGLYRILLERGLTFATAESLTCGMIAAKMGAVPGVSAVYAGGFVTYSPSMKIRALGVSEETIAAHGTVSRECAGEMCRNAALRSGADLAVSATGNAGPDPSEGKPVGLVYIGVCFKDRVSVKEYRFEGDRSAVREAAAVAALGDAADALAHGDEAADTAYSDAAELNASGK